MVNWFVALFKELGFEGCSSHSGRRSFITVAARNVHRSGCSLRDVQLLAGHRSIETTERYIDGDTCGQRKLVGFVKARLSPNWRCECACHRSQSCSTNAAIRNAALGLEDANEAPTAAMCMKSSQGNQVMREFTLQATLIATIRVKAETRAEAEQKLHAALAASDANLGTLDDEPIVVPVEVEGDLDLIEGSEDTGEDPPQVEQPTAPLVACVDHGEFDGIELAALSRSPELHKHRTVEPIPERLPLFARSITIATPLRLGSETGYSEPSVSDPTNSKRYKSDCRFSTGATA